MNSETNSRRVKEIFEKAIEFTSTSERQVYVNGTCDSDSSLLVRVQTLLRAHFENGETFLPGAPAAALVPFPTGASGEKAGVIVGRYKLLQKIGEGGCGVVWMAEQEEPVRRRVALKIIKLGMDTRSVIARFEAERQALALMDHPNIARVLDGGSTDTGRPYFVMELVRGVRLTAYCDEQKMPIRERLDLFIKICQAIQHAHQKGIIHRDIKPSNILVTLHDGMPVPKVIDFGIAKATDQRLTDKTLFTQYDAFIGTPAYMSPEQAELSGLDVDTRTDIYSLGVLLYELLIGVTPFDVQALAKSGLDEMRRIIREHEPKRPSTRLSTLEMTEATAVTTLRREKLPALSVLLRGDLDWIVMKCLEKDRTRRYESASGLAADLRRHLNNEAIAARPPSPLYRLQKAIRRNRLAFAAGTAVVAALVVGIVIASSQAVRARKAEQAARLAERSERSLSEQARADRDRAVRAEAAAKNAELATRDELENARATLTFIQDHLLGQASPDRQPDPHLTVRTMLDRASAQLDQPSGLPPKVEAGLRQQIGSVYFHLGEYALAIDHLERALRVQRPLLGNAHEDTLRTLHVLGETYWWNGDDIKCIELAQEGWELSRRALGETNLITLDFRADVAAASIYTEPATIEETERRIRDSLQVIRGALGESAKLTLQLKIVLGMHLANRGKFPDAETTLSDALERHGVVFPETDPLMLQAMAMLARVYTAQSKYERAETLNRRVLDLRRSTLSPDHAMTVSVECNLAMIYVLKGEYAKADEICARLLALLAEGGLVENRLAVRGVVNLVRLYRLNGQWKNVDELAGALLAAGRKQFREEAVPFELITMDDEWGRSLTARHRYAEAEPLFQRAVQVGALRNNTHGRLFNAMSRLGECLYQQNKKLGQAETLLRTAALEHEKRYKQIPDHMRLDIVGGTLKRLADFYEATGRFAEAAVWRQKIAALEKSEGRAVNPIDAPIF